MNPSLDVPAGGRCRYVPLHRGPLRLGAVAGVLARLAARRRQPS